MNEDWVHCNKCFRSETPLSFYLSRCQHIFCRECLASVCSICGANMKAIEINSSMSSEMKLAFEDIEKVFERMKRIVQFQWMQRSSLEAAKIPVVVKYMEMQKDIKRLRKGLFLLNEDANKEKYKFNKVRENVEFLLRYKSQGASKRKTPHLFTAPSTSFSGPGTQLAHFMPHQQHRSMFDDVKDRSMRNLYVTPAFRDMSRLMTQTSSTCTDMKGASKYLGPQRKDFFNLHNTVDSSYGSADVKQKGSYGFNFYKRQ